MTIEVELYSAPGYEPAGRRPLVPLLREAYERILGSVPDDAKFRLHLVSVDDREEIPGRPSLVNLRGSHGYAHVTIISGGDVVYQHHDTVAEIIARPLQHRLAEEYPDVDHWGFGLVGQGLEALELVRPTPEVAGSVRIHRVRTRTSGNRLRELPDPDPEPSTLAALGVADGAPARGVDADESAAVGVVVQPIARAALLRRAFSGEVEEGGFVIGHRFADASRPGRTLLEVTAVVAAESTGASLLRFTFTGESFLRLGDQLARRGRGEEVLGWYHTHLFAATRRFGLSSVDVRLHTSTFRRPWQVAALVNLTTRGRVLRWYGRDAHGGDGLAEVPYWFADDVAERSSPSVRHRVQLPPEDGDGGGAPSRRFVADLTGELTEHTAERAPGPAGEPASGRTAGAGPVADGEEPAQPAADRVAAHPEAADRVAAQPPADQMAAEP